MAHLHSPNWHSARQPPTLRPDEIHLWHAPLAALPCRRAWLGPAEQARLERLSDPAARQTFCAARTLLRRLLGGYLDRAPDAVDIRLDAQGRPHLAEPALDFNLSHAGGQLLLAFARGRHVGVDCEAVRAVQGMARIAERLFDAEERAHWERDGGTPEGFFRIWTRLEARQKCLGEGLFARRVAPSEVRCRSFHAAGLPACVAWSPPGEVRIRFLRPQPV